MTEWLPFFPLNLVAFPGEPLNLHVFEPRYKELVEDSLKGDQRFGIPSYVKNTIEWGTEMQILEVCKEYDDGRKDIKTKALRLFEVVSFKNPWEGKPYAGGTVRYVDYIDNEDTGLKKEIIDLIKKMYELVQIEGTVFNDELRMFDFAHRLGLSKEEEFELLKITEERHRQEFVFRHLNKIIPQLRNIQDTKERIKLNGHFRTYDPLNF